MTPLILPSSYSTFIKSCSVDWNRDGNKSVAVIPLTPLGASATWCTEIKTWPSSLVFPANNHGPNKVISRDSIVYHLLLNAKGINDRLLEALRDIDYRKRNRIRNAYDIEAKKPNDWFHDITQTLVADRFVWAYRRPADQDLRFSQGIHGAGATAMGIATSKLKVFHDLLESWRETVNFFIELWEKKSSSISAPFYGDEPHPVSPPHSEAGPVQVVLETLISGIQESKVAAIENNFCRASLGLLALKLVCLRFLENDARTDIYHYEACRKAGDEKFD